MARNQRNKIINIKTNKKIKIKIIRHKKQIQNLIKKKLRNTMKIDEFK